MQAIGNNNSGFGTKNCFYFCVSSLFLEFTTSVWTQVFPKSPLEILSVLVWNRFMLMHVLHITG